MTTRAQSLRANPTPAEKRLWRLLYPFRTGGYHFRKQVAIGPYFADIACHHAHLVIEVDGDTHGSNAAIHYDAERDALFRTKGLRILRFANGDVLNNPDGVFEIINRALLAYPPTQRPSRTMDARS